MQYVWNVNYATFRGKPLVRGRGLPRYILLWPTLLNYVNTSKVFLSLLPNSMSLNLEWLNCWQPLDLSCRSECIIIIMACNKFVFYLLILNNQCLLTPSVGEVENLKYASCNVMDSFISAGQLWWDNCDDGPPDSKCLAFTTTNRLHSIGCYCINIAKNHTIWCELEVVVRLQAHGRDPCVDVCSGILPTMCI